MTPQLPSPYDSGIIKGQPSSPISKDAEITQLKERVKFLESQLSNRNQFNRRRDTAIDLVADVQSPPFISKYDLESEISILAESSAKLTDLTNQLNESASRRTQLVAAKEPIDLIYKNIITVEQAEERLAVYRDRIYKEYPLIEIPENLSAMEFSRTQPFLFNAIMSACNVITKNTTRDTALSIDNEAIKTIAVEVMVVGTKSVELVKAFLVLCLYYNSPELFKQRRYHMLNTICVSLLHDLGIVVRPTYSYNQQEGTIKQDIPVVGQSNDEYRSLVLTTYFTTVSICLVLRRSIYARWTSYVEECCTALENSPQEKYQTLALFARMNNKLDKIHHIIHAPEVPERPSNASNYIIQELQRSLSELKEKIKENQHGLLSYYYSIEAYLHEPMLSSVFKSDSGLDSNSIKSLCFCTGSCLNALDEYSKLTPDQIVLMPFSFGSRVMYTTGMLLRLRYLILSLPSQIDKELVPKRAVTAIQKVSKLVEQANILNPSNHYLTKMRLVLQLFIQTYATQVLDLLRKNGETPQNFKPNESEFQHLKSLAKEYNSARHNKESMLADSRDSEPLDVLSYAATFRRDENNHNNNNNNKLNVNLANPDQLENSYMVLNDEFWSNLLSTDSTTDRINFTNNNFNGSSINDEVFFMNN
ncbi:WAR1 Transcriptional regulator WAR1 [Candida maltosa Xu316]